MIYVFASNCMACSSSISNAVRVVRQFARQKDIEVKTCSTSKGQCLNIASGFTGYIPGKKYEPFVSYNGTSMPLKGVTIEALEELIA